VAGRSRLIDDTPAPIVLAPMAGGPSTVALAAAVSDAGGLGFLAAGYLPHATVEEQLDEYRALTDRPVGVNVFSPPAGPAPEGDYRAYVERLSPEAQGSGTALGKPRFDDDDFTAKLALLEQRPVAVVSFVFGCPAPNVVERLRAVGSEVWTTVTTPKEAEIAAAAGVDALVVQGVEAGGHRGGFEDGDPESQLGVLSLLQLVRSRTDLPLIAAGGVSTGRALAAVLAAGAGAGQVGTAFMLCPEAATSGAHRRALASPAPTALTRAFSGRLARGIVNRFMRDHGAVAPRAYPEIHHVTAPLRRAARERGDGEVINLWAGQAHELAQALPAAEVVAALVTEARESLTEAGRLL
jgi:nitronate monooxygenase